MKVEDFATFYDYMEYRLQRRVHTAQKRATRALRKYKKILTDKDHPDELDRRWLDQFVVGQGVDVCCGDFLMGEEDEPIGVDGAVSYIGESAAQVLGADFRGQGDQISFAKPSEFDFVVTNYFEALPHTLAALNEWWRVLKDGGKLAMVCRNAEAYSKKGEGALRNRQRMHTYTPITIKHYLHRASFKEVSVEETPHGTMRVLAIK